MEEGYGEGGTRGQKKKHGDTKSYFSLYSLRSPRLCGEISYSVLRKIGG